mgnify:CR=1 FL=1|tara:strand:+ start:5627 stop:6577 length:951 start_codon:yes stop_codon:yes gene_type:complete
MATSVYPATGGFSDNTTQANFIPELWSDEIRAAYEKRLVRAGLVKRLPMVGKKGDTIHIPAPTRGTATAKAAKTAVTVQANTESEVQVLIDKHYEYSKLMEDVTEIQALSSMRGFYTDDAGYALSTQTDSDLAELGKAIGDQTANWVGSGSYYNDASSGLTAYAVDTVTTSDLVNDAAIRGIIKLLDDNDVPFDERYFVIPPSMRKTIMGIDRYVSSDFVDGRGVSNGRIGNLYGVEIYVTSNCSTTETAAQNSAGGEIKAATIFHKEAFILAEQQNIRTQTQYKQEWLGTLFTADTIYGVKTYRPDAAFNLMVNA